MKKYLMPIYIAIFLIGATALWYFGHHRPAQKILKAEPKKVYKTTPLPPRDLSVKPTPSDSIQEPREAGTDITVEGTDTESENIENTATSEKIDDSQVYNENADSVEPLSREDISVDDPAAAQAFDKYITAESEYLAAQDMLQAALEARPIDWDRVSDETDNLKNAARLRKEALQNLAPYSEEAAKLLEKMKENEKRAEEMTAGHRAKIRELKDKMREMDEVLESFRSK